MNAQERRNEILKALHRAKGPINATELAGRFGVSRQIVVGDVALLRAGGQDISATPRGYLLAKNSTEVTATVACNHNSQQMVEELNAIVDQGCTVEDVVVEHPLYGQLVGKLELSNRYEVSQFAKRCQEAEAQPLSNLTDGVHLHTVRGPNEAALQRVRDSLREMGILLGES